jgi:hypothetical protein
MYDTRRCGWPEKPRRRLVAPTLLPFRYWTKCRRHVRRPTMWLAPKAQALSCRRTLLPFRYQTKCSATCAAPDDAAGPESHGQPGRPPVKWMGSDSPEPARNRQSGLPERDPKQFEEHEGE